MSFDLDALQSGFRQHLLRTSEEELMRHMCAWSDDKFEAEMLIIHQIVIKHPRIAHDCCRESLDTTSQIIATSAARRLTYGRRPVDCTAHDPALPAQPLRCSDGIRADPRFT